MLEKTSVPIQPTTGHILIFFTQFGRSGDQKWGKRWGNVWPQSGKHLANIWQIEKGGSPLTRPGERVGRDEGGADHGGRRGSRRTSPSRRRRLGRRRSNLTTPTFLFLTKFTKFRVLFSIWPNFSSTTSAVRRPECAPSKGHVFLGINNFHFDALSTC